MPFLSSYWSGVGAPAHCLLLVAYKNTAGRIIAYVDNGPKVCATTQDTHHPELVSLVSFGNLGYTFLPS